MKDTILHRNAAAAETFREMMRTARDLQRQLHTERSRRHNHTPEYIALEERFDQLAADIVWDMLEVAAVYSADELDAAEAMLHGMRLAVPQDEMGG